MRVKIIDNLPPETVAMLQALYSRSSNPVVKQLEKVNREKSNKFMEQYYIGYGHKSIGDCGTTTIFIENVSILAAKAIQSSPLYSGQESSTRYIDFTNQELYLPHPRCEHIMAGWLDLYSYLSKHLPQYISKANPRKPGDNQEIYDKAVRARAFDIARGFLPCGVTTNLSWHTNLRQAYDHCLYLLGHPLLEVQAIAEEILASLTNKYPSSFPIEFPMKTLRYYESFPSYYYYFSNHSDMPLFMQAKLFETPKTIMTDELSNAMKSRPKGVELPRIFNELGEFSIKFNIDFASWRDLARHRNGYCPVPFISKDWMIHNFYLTKIPKELREKTKQTISTNTQLLAGLSKMQVPNLYDIQYLLPMGMEVQGLLRCGVPQLTYIVELRTSKTVHPTLRKLAQQFAQIIKSVYPDMALYVDLSPDSWNTKRGFQDIVEHGHKNTV